MRYQLSVLLQTPALLPTATTAQRLLAPVRAAATDVVDMATTLTMEVGQQLDMELMVSALTTGFSCFGPGFSCKGGG